MRIFFLFISGLFLSQILLAQVTFPENIQLKNDTSSILRDLNIKQDPRLEKMLNWHMEKNKKIDGIQGFRVEIFFSSDLKAKEMAESIKVDFLSKYPDYNVHIRFIAPNFRVRAGDFRTKNEALKLHKKIQRNFPAAFIVPDIIDFPLLKPLNYE
ncbi:MAG: SPOR domain-containing protein [Prolixibacteraceae bacterium]|jgi:hypothetical protein|nr:SPOR domain-containing protein [Prolixibacteraceae bacterium]MBT6764310.1 SPOR domain-containing protein [Prolixibacteraceae bacterium]MBT6997455.1 SPOR domain-containing protein [Prolixibacteraceae bacterium]MBT7395567.1 SPOR domain-containing protein [Prolixibacteraceae bacterium]